jgi:hypothetical protein
VNVHLDAKLIETTPRTRHLVDHQYKVLARWTRRCRRHQRCSAASSRGTGNGQNTQTLNGVNVGDPAAIGFAAGFMT